MKRFRGSSSCLALIATVTLAGLAALAGPAHADPVALDYHAKVDGCPSAERFGDEVAAKLGFVPWDPQAATAIRIRIDADGNDLVATIEQPDGSSKVLRAATCPKLDEVLVSAIAVVLDKTAAPPAPPVSPPANDDDLRLRTLERPATTNGLLTIALRAKDNRVLEVSRVDGSVASAYGMAMSFAALCKAPCETHILPGTYSLLVRDVTTDHAAFADATIKVNSTLEFDYTSHAAERATTTSRTNWGFWLGFIAGTVATAYVVETQTTDARWLHGFDVGGGLITAIITGRIARATAPGMQDDKTAITVRPGLGDRR